ncbi:MAG: hypothetical protein JRI36_09500 [Deltaproteobacteria bacterium]|nr:hypothetical protein [Deltaproteobacteria bacterium]
MDNFDAILNRVKEKQQDYASYDFTKLEMAALNTFFDLAQEYDDLKNLYLVCVTVPHVFMDIESTLYLIDPKTQTIVPAASSRNGLAARQDDCPPFIKITDTAYQHDSSYVVPIHGKRTPTSRLLFHGTGNLIGIFEAARDTEFSEMERFFIQKYVNRVGYNLYNKTLAEQNIQHLKFINNLVADIEHNVIVPNLRYKVYFRQIRRYLTANKGIENELEGLMEALKSQDRDLYAKLSAIVEGMEVINRNIFDHQEKIERHYKNTSLFLESLFRPDHFVFGEYILKKRPWSLWKDIVLPQLDRYADRFSKQGIKVTHTIADEKAQDDVSVKVDKGLLAQVVANLLSNAAKYAEPAPNPSGRMEKRVDCRARVLENFFGQGHHGVRFQVFSSGDPIMNEDSERVFDEGYRLTQNNPVSGKGHGLHFVKNVVEVHGGIVGHKAKDNGNEFYFVIPA